MINKKIIQDSIKTILTEGLNQDLNNPHLQDTPRRVADAMEEIFNGYKDDPKQYNTIFPYTPKYPNLYEDDIIILGPIKCYSICSHHLLPFKMEIYVGYIPKEHIIGISKIERITQAICHKLQVQENIGHEIIQTLNEILNPYGVIVYINNSEHMCMTMRGVKTAHAGLTTVVKDGLFQEEKYQNKFFNMINKK